MKSWMFWSVLGGLFGFAVIYNWFIAVSERHGWIEGYVALFVAAGVGITIGGIAVLDPQAALLALFCFTASGIPMIVGSASRYMAARERGQKRLEEWGNDQSEGVAE